MDDSVLTARFDKIDSMFATMLDAIQSLHDETEMRFQKVDQRFDGMDQRFDGIDQRFDRMDRRFDRLEARVENLETEVRSGFHRLESRPTPIKSESPCDVASQHRGTTLLSTKATRQIAAKHPSQEIVRGAPLPAGVLRP